MSEGNKKFPVLSLTAARVNANLTQKEFAKKCGVSESTVIYWENGKRSPNLRMLDKIESVLGIPLDFVRIGK